jgi:hypothetical protein
MRGRTEGSLLLSLTPLFLSPTPVLLSQTKEEKEEMSRAILTPATTLAERKSARNDNTNGQPDMDRENITTPFVEYIPETMETCCYKWKHVNI